MAWRGSIGSSARSSSAAIRRPTWKPPSPTSARSHPRSAAAPSWTAGGGSSPFSEIVPPLAGRPPDQLLEGAAERRFRLVADLLGHLRDVAAVGEVPRRELHAPERQVVHRRIADERGEAF